MARVAVPSLDNMSNSLLTWQGQRSSHNEMESTSQTSNIAADDRSHPESDRGTLSTQDRSTIRRLHGIAEADIGKSVCYFIGADDGPIKIGYATNPKARLQNLREASWLDLRILATASGGPYRERAYHVEFGHRRIRGEWFERCPEIEAEIDRLYSEVRHG